MSSTRVKGHSCLASQDKKLFLIQLLIVNNNIQQFQWGQRASELKKIQGWNIWSWIRPWHHFSGTVLPIILLEAKIVNDWLKTAWKLMPQFFISRFWCHYLCHYFYLPPPFFLMMSLMGVCYCYGKSILFSQTEQ